MKGARRTAVAACLLAVGCGGEDSERGTRFFPFFPHASAPTELAVLSTLGLTAHQHFLAASLAGIVNAERARLYILREHVPADRYWVEMYASDYGIPYQEAGSLSSALLRFGPEIAGAILFDPEIEATINVAGNLGSLERAIIAAPEDERLLADAGIRILGDLRGQFATKEEADRYDEEILLPRFRTDVVANLATDDWELRDYLMAHSIFTFRHTPFENWSRFAWVLDQFPSNIPVLGYFARSGSEEFFGNYLVSSHSKWWVPSDNATNLSVHSTVRARRAATSVRPPIEPFEISPDITYVTAVFSDGDNYSCALRQIYDRFVEPDHGPFPVGWTLPGSAVELMPAVLDYYYSRAPRHDDFVPVSGLSYAHVGFYGDPEWFTEASAESLELSGNDAIWSLDPQGMLFPILEQRALFQGLDISGYLFNYFANGSFYGFTDEGLPMLFTRTSYPTPPENIDDVIEQGIAKKRPGRPQIVFLGLNLWDMRVAHLAQGFAPYLDRPDVRIVPATALLASLREWNAARSSAEGRGRGPSEDGRGNPR